MESRMVKFYSKREQHGCNSCNSGHFATSHSHINYYIDITSLKTRIQEAKEVARVFASEDRKSFLCGYDCMYGRHGGDRSVFGRGI